MTIDSTSGTASSQGTADNAASTSTVPNSTVNKNMFLELLVAQLRNQNPMKPSDGTQFLTQLAQFEQLEQTLNMSQDVSVMRQDLDQLVKPATVVIPTT
jgi:flagellar basal-body rod modification protein FlgD